MIVGDATPDDLISFARSSVASIAESLDELLDILESRKAAGDPLTKEETARFNRTLYAARYAHDCIRAMQSAKPERRKRKQRHALSWFEEQRQQPEVKDGSRSAK